MSISSILNTGLSALQANQQAMKVTSNNVANVNTAGYSRLDVQFVSRHDSGGIQGVDINVARIASAYLAAAEMRGAADVSAATQLSSFMDRAQGLLGDPSGSGNVFATLDPVFDAFGGLSVDPASALRRSTALSNVQTMLTQFETTSRELSALREESHVRAGAVMEEANALLSSIAKLNQSIQRSTIAGSSTADAETEQSRMLDRLSEIIDVRVQNRSLGGIDVRTADGLLLADIESARLAFSEDTDGEAYPGVVLIPARSTTSSPLDSHLKAGELKGLLQTRDREIPNLQLAFAEFAAGTVDALNAAHNAASSVPAPATLTGSNSGLLSTDLLNFTGSTDIGITNSDGVLQRRFHVDFGAATITDDLGNVTAFTGTVGAFATALDTAMTGVGDVSFAGGSLQISTSVAGGSVAVTDDPSSPARRAGKGFAQTFGLNDLVSKTGPVNYSTGLSNTDAHGFTAGQTMTFAIRNDDGAIVRKVDFTVGAGTTLASLRSDIDTALSGYGQTQLDATGRLTLAPVGTGVSRLDVIADTTTRGDTNLSASQIFGLGETIPADRASRLAVRSDIRSNPNLLATAVADLSTATAGTTRVLSLGDGRGATGIEAAGATTRQFQAAGSLTAQATSVSEYAARLAGHAGLRAEALSSSQAAAQSVRQEVHERRLNEEGVNLDEEMVKMTTYQQSYAAASRLIQAAKDMYDIVVNMV